MTHDERLAMRDRLMSYAEAHAPTGSMKSPYWQFFMWSSSQASEKFAYAFAVLLLVLATGGVSLVSEKALPGDALYSMKVGVTEPVRSALMVSPVEQVRWQGELANRRLDEAQTLQAEGRLDATTTNEIQKSFAKHEDTLNFLEKKIEKTSQAKAAQQVRSDFEEKKQSRQSILNTIREKMQQQQTEDQKKIEERDLKKSQEGKSEVKVESLESFKKNKSEGHGGDN